MVHKTTMNKYKIAGLVGAGAIALMTFSTVLAEDNMMGRNDGEHMKTNASVSIDTACMKTAIMARDAAVTAAFDANYTAMKAGLTARTSAISAAWDQTNAETRRADLKTAWTNWNTTAQNARKDMRAAKNSAWTAFKTAAKACRGGSASGNGDISKDASL